VISTGIEAGYDVLLECESNEHYTEMEQYTDYQLKITNSGDSEDTYILTKDSPPEHWQTQLSVAILTIPAYDSRYVTLKVKPTCECESGVKVYINVTATSESDPSVFDIVQTITTYANVKVSLEKINDYVQIQQGESYDYEILIENEGSENDSFQLSVLSLNEQLTTELETEYITLSSKKNRTFNISVNSLKSTSHGYYEFKIEAVSLHNPKKSDSLTVTTIVGGIDLKSRNITFSNNNPSLDEIITISMEILNNGTVECKDIIITIFLLSEDERRLEIGSEMISIKSKETVNIQKDMKIYSNTTGILIEAKIKGKYEIWQKSYNLKELGLSMDNSSEVPYYFIILLILVLLIIIGLILKFKKLNKEK
jgi:uncharacterized membrane protein